jgi:hypothetical protein
MPVPTGGLMVCSDAVCDALTVQGLCDSCRRDTQRSAAILSSRYPQIPLSVCVCVCAHSARSVRVLEQSCERLRTICMTCTRSRDPVIGCDSIDCGVYFARRTSARTLAVMLSFRGDMRDW